MNENTLVFMEVRVFFNRISTKRDIHDATIQRIPIVYWLSLRCLDYIKSQSERQRKEKSEYPPLLLFYLTHCLHGK